MVAPSGEGGRPLHAAGHGRPEGRADRHIIPTPLAHPERRSADDKEIEAIREVFGRGRRMPADRRQGRYKVAHRSLARRHGVQEAIYSLLMMNNGFICESAHIDELDPAFADMPILRARRDDAQLGTC